jgi:hypothetical protein
MENEDYENAEKRLSVSCKTEKNSEGCFALADLYRLRNMISKSEDALAVSCDMHLEKACVVYSLRVKDKKKLVKHKTQISDLCKKGNQEACAGLLRINSSEDQAEYKASMEKLCFETDSPDVCLLYLVSGAAGANQKKRLSDKMQKQCDSDVYGACLLLEQLTSDALFAEFERTRGSGTNYAKITRDLSILTKHMCGLGAAQSCMDNSCYELTGSVRSGLNSAVSIKNYIWRIGDPGSFYKGIPVNFCLSSQSNVNLNQASLQVGSDFNGVIASFDSACELGYSEGCKASEYTKVLSTVLEPGKAPDPGLVKPALLSSCEQGKDSYSCLLVAYAYAVAMVDKLPKYMKLYCDLDRGCSSAPILRAGGMGKDSMGWIHSQCKSSTEPGVWCRAMVEACYAQGVSGFSCEQISKEDPLDLLRSGCNRGDGLSCLVAGTNSKNAVDEERTLYRKSCDLGIPWACWLRVKSSKESGFSNDAKVYATKACKLGMQDLCSAP